MIALSGKSAGPRAAKSRGATARAVSLPRLDCGYPEPCIGVSGAVRHFLHAELVSSRFRYADFSHHVAGVASRRIRRVRVFKLVRRHELPQSGFQSPRPCGLRIAPRRLFHNGSRCAHFEGQILDRIVSGRDVQLRGTGARDGVAHDCHHIVENPRALRSPAGRCLRPQRARPIVRAKRNRDTHARTMSTAIVIDVIACSRFEIDRRGNQKRAGLPFAGCCRVFGIHSVLEVLLRNAQLQTRAGNVARGVDLGSSLNAG